MRNKRSAVSKNNQIEGGANQLAMNCPGLKEKNQKDCNLIDDLRAKTVFDEIMGVVSSKKGGFFFRMDLAEWKNIYMECIDTSVRSNGGIILNVASSGIAATLLPSGLCNGTRLQITQLGKNVVKAKALNGTSASEEILIHIMDMNPSETTLPFKMTRRQFPIIISFAMTINKSQGQSLSNAAFLVFDIDGYGNTHDGGGSNGDEKPQRRLLVGRVLADDS
ncbi:hypothetical protein K1719_033284 [Acacia pycnantha]|nr:hypothetical protein K1719_033284 [Acacia pycnantha]